MTLRQVSKERKEKLTKTGRKLKREKNELGDLGHRIGEGRGEPINTTRKNLMTNGLADVKMLEIKRGARC